MTRKNDKQQAVWTDEDVDTLVKLWHEGVAVKKIADTIGKSHNSTKMYVQRHREALGLDKREFVRVERAKAQCPEFDRKWYGSVPCGHWMITKPWKKRQAQ